MKSILLKLVVPLLGIIAMLAFVVTFNPIKPQDASTHVWNGGVDSCGKVHVQFLSESSCTSGSYQTVVGLTSNDGQSHDVTTLFQNFFCGPNDHLGDGVNPTSCIKNGKPVTGHFTVSSNQSVSVNSPSQNSKDYGFSNFCGIYQSDFSFTVDGTSCRFGYDATDPNSSHPVLAASYCDSNITCHIPVTATPTQPVVTATATPTTPVVVTATPTQPTTVNGCDHTTQTGTNNNSNCNNNEQQQQQQQINNQTQNNNNNQNVNITLNNPAQQQQQQVLAAASAPTQLPKTGAEGQILLGLLALGPIGWKLRKLA